MKQKPNYRKRRNSTSSWITGKPQVDRSKADWTNPSVEAG